MHFYWFGAVHHVIVLALMAFFVLFAASKAEGFVKVLGQVLGYLLLIAALLWIVGCATAPMFGGHPFGMTFVERTNAPMMGPVWTSHPAPSPAATPGK
ncbi:MAG: hypothetical protein KGJ79_12760 [Alphaproteobacteria bacterium]|nr:hypothetical protein [Alphaproteobacteria bacterium]MDE2112007.1 hypothetical protein [Alphaproteobacteria bacterium]MDE2492335.1 hypothetical protein [Alphaproteobacteria bacterium]